MRFVINDHGAIVGTTNDPLSTSPEVPNNYRDDEMGCYVLRDGVALLDANLVLTKAKNQRIARIKTEAANMIAATDWKLQRAQERDAAGWASLSDIDVVLAEREAIRQSSNAAETAVNTLTDIAAVQAYTWAVDVAVPAPMRLTRGEFLDRFTEVETEAILAMAENNASLKRWLLRLENSDWIKTSEAAPGLQALEIAGLIAPGRADQILA
ncbi:hypothetical protein ACO0LB_06240 [Undibacterium sp. SXout7W]|uniref:hypothetical protein n=1 Tax=Undibacterium sp. SXout7W TaxID=3413049 RepID=UPI003BEF5D51